MKEMVRRADKLIEVEKYERNVKTAPVAANNHYAESVPTTSNAFREMLGLRQVNRELKRN